jgi:hypothetical protein
MFIVYKNGKKTRHTFTQYEHARQWVRKQLRKIDPLRSEGQPLGPMSLFGFQIKHVN